MSELTNKNQTNTGGQTSTQNPTFDLFLVLTLSLGTLLGCLNLTIFNVAMPTLIEYFHTDISTVQWLSSGYMLAAGIITPISAFLGDHFGYKRTFTFTTFLVLLLAVVGMFSWNIEVLIIVRILFGLTAGLLMPLSMAMLYQNVPVIYQAKAAGIWGVANLLGGALPTGLAGIIISFASWRTLFLLMVPLAILLLFCCNRFLPNDQHKQYASLDGFGLVLTAVGSFILLFGFSNLSKWGFSVRFFLVSGVGIALLLLYAIKNWTNDEAMLNLAVLRYPRYVAAIAADMMNIVALYMITFVMPLFLQNGLRLSAMTTGAIMMSCSIVTIVSMPFATKLLDRQGEKALALAGIFFMVLGSSFFLHITPAVSIILIVVAMVIRCFGLSFMNLLSTNTAMAAVPPQLAGHASSLANWLRQMTGALVTSIASNVVNLRLIAYHAQTAEEISEIYVSSTSLLTGASCIMLLAIIPVALKFFRNKAQMQADQQ